MDEAGPLADPTAARQEQQITGKERKEEKKNEKMEDV